MWSLTVQDPGQKMVTRCGVEGWDDDHMWCKEQDARTAARCSVDGLVAGDIRCRGRVDRYRLGRSRGQMEFQQRGC
jgi:hypothetical protein